MAVWIIDTTIASQGQDLEINGISLTNTLFLNFRVKSPSAQVWVVIPVNLNCSNLHSKRCALVRTPMKSTYKCRHLTCPKFYPVYFLFEISFLLIVTREITVGTLFKLLPIHRLQRVQVMISFARCLLYFLFFLSSCK